MILRPDQAPAKLRAGAYGVAVAVLLYLCLAPGKDLPPVSFWDKAEHATAWFVLAALGLAFWPNRAGRVVGFSLTLGAIVEVLQAIMPLGRDGDWRDWVADAIGVSVALLGWALIRRLAATVPVRA